MINHTVILSIGSNDDNEDVIEKAKMLLQNTSANTVFTRTLHTNDVTKRGRKYWNCMAQLHTAHTYKQFCSCLKQIENRCGDRKALRTRGIVRMDIDVLAFDQARFHDDDWKRYYVKLLHKELESLTQKDQLS